MNRKFVSKILMITILIMYVYNIFGCKGSHGLSGLDGQDGDAYLALTWYGTLHEYATDDPAIPLIFFSDQYYKCLSPGTYAFAYTTYDYSSWVGNYTIEVIEGEPGEPGKSGKSFWRSGRDGYDGADGYDLYYVLGLWSAGPDLFIYDSPQSKTAVPLSEKNRLNEVFTNNSNTKEENDISDFSIDLPDSEIFTKSISRGKYRFSVRYWRAIK